MAPMPGKKISVTTRGNKVLEQALKRVNQDPELQTLWRITNVTAIKRLNMTDHGISHFQLVAEVALKMLRILEKRQVRCSICRDYGLSHDYAELVVFLGAVLHDVGMSVHRTGHEEFSLFLSDRLLQRLLDFLPVSEKTIVISEVLHAIISHRSDGRPLTVEAGIIRVADALDMSQGRTRLPYQQGKLDIHSVSALAIDEVEIKAGKPDEDPIRVNIIMNHTAGIFQVDELLQKKVKGSGIERHLDIVVYIEKEGRRQLFKHFLKRG